MTKFDFSKFDEQVDLEGLKKDIEGASSSDDTSREDVPLGIYDVSISKMEQVMTKKAPARPMLSIWFKVNDGEHKNQLIFMNQVITHPFSIHLASEFLKSLGSGIEDISFESYEQFGDLILDVYEAIEGKKDYALDYGENDKGFSEFEITDIFDK